MTLIFSVASQKCARDGDNTCVCIALLTGCTLHATSRSQLRVLDKDCQVSMDILKVHVE